MHKVNFNIYHYIFLQVELANLEQLNLQWKNLLQFLTLHLNRPLNSIYRWKATCYETYLNFPEAKFYLHTHVSGGKVPHFSVLSRELHAFSLRVTRYTAGGDKLTFERTKERISEVKCLFSGLCVHFYFQSKIECLGSKTSGYAKIFQ